MHAQQPFEGRLRSQQAKRSSKHTSITEMTIKAGTKMPPTRKGLVKTDTLSKLMSPMSTSKTNPAVEQHPPPTA